jgi:hypothetical protein
MECFLFCIVDKFDSLSSYFCDRHVRCLVNPFTQVLMPCYRDLVLVWLAIF